MIKAPPSYLENFLKVLGLVQPRVEAREALISGLGGFVAILGVVYVSGRCVGTESAGMLVASMGASAVLLFALPHGQLSQPWALVGGHVVSAVVGVACARLVDDPLMAAALAVGTSIGLMQFLRCVHPPGGATALSAVVGGPAIHALGMRFVLTPVLLNALLIVSVAVAWNCLFWKRRYPFYFASKDALALEQALDESIDELQL